MNIYAECVVRDGWLKQQPESERKRWFMSTAAYFAKQNDRRRQQNKNLAENNGSVWRGMTDEELEARF